MSVASTITTRAAPFRSIAQILVAMFCFALVDALAKSVALQYPANEVTFFRMLFGLLPAVAFCWRGSPLVEKLKTLDIRAQTVRAVTLLSCALLCRRTLRTVERSRGNRLQRDALCHSRRR
jgi:hypothetical protein